MEAVDAAEMALARGDRVAAQGAFRKALAKEQLAARSTRVEPSRTVLFRSAATLALRCGEQQIAADLARAGLAGNESRQLERELREVLERTEEAGREQRLTEEHATRFPWLAARDRRTSVERVVSGWRASLLPLVALISALIGVASIYFGRNPGGMAAPAVALSFEHGDEGWSAERQEGDGCVSVVPSREKPRSGQGSLKIEMNLVGADPRRRKCETLLRLENPRDLTGRTVTALVFNPAVIQGDTGGPNVMRLFVRDVHHHSRYGAWVKFTSKGWSTIELPVDKVSQAVGWTHPDFDPTRVVQVGLLVSVGEHSMATFRGATFLDDVSW
jgi:hypothetical protein